jgi:ElaA protein
VLSWTWARFADLCLDDLYDALALRCRVFILEQGPYQDPDGLDRQSWHLLGRLAQPWGELPAGEAVAYLRVVDAGSKFDEPSIGRVVNHPALRGQGLGRVLIAQALQRCDASAHPGQPNRISAQAHLAAFYGAFGYATVGEPYLEDDIPHIEMLRPPQHR